MTGTTDEFGIEHSLECALADLRGGARDAPPRGPNSLIFMQFSAKI